MRIVRLSRISRSGAEPQTHAAFPGREFREWMLSTGRRQKQATRSSTGVEGDEVAGHHCSVTLAMPPEPGPSDEGKNGGKLGHTFDSNHTCRRSPAVGSSRDVETHRARILAVAHGSLPVQKPSLEHDVSHKPRLRQQPVSKLDRAVVSRPEIGRAVSPIPEFTSDERLVV
jgi:hypothetical protein